MSSLRFFFYDANILSTQFCYSLSRPNSARTLFSLVFLAISGLKWPTIFSHLLIASTPLMNSAKRAVAESLGSCSLSLKRCSYISIYSPSIYIRRMPQISRPSEIVAFFRKKEIESSCFEVWLNEPSAVYTFPRVKSLKITHTFSIGY
jgi:hypothetical protein